MKIRFIGFVFLLLFGFFANANTTAAGYQQFKTSGIKPGNDYKAQWRKADSLIGKDLPKSALEVVNAVYADAKTTANYPQYVKAVIYKLRISSMFEEDYYEKAITDVQSELSTAHAPAKQVLHSVLAELYWGYYQRNRYAFLNRTETQGYVTDDIKTWDLRQIISKVVGNYRLSLQDAALLKSVKIDLYDAVISIGDSSRRFRPTLFDFVAQRAVDFFTNSESGLTQPIDKFVMNDAALFSPANGFAVYKFTSADSLSLDYYGLCILQDIIKFHLTDSDPTALIDADLERLDFVRKNSVVDNKDRLYIDALVNMEKTYDLLPASSAIAYQIAVYYNERSKTYNPAVSDSAKWDAKKACDVCRNVMDKFPKTQGANNCKCLLNEITLPTLALTTENINTPQKTFRTLVTYKNAPKVYFRLIKMDVDKDRSIREKLYNADLVEYYLKLKSVKEWSLDLPDDKDYQQHSVEISMPELDYGYYILLAAPDAEFATKDLPVAYNNFWISRFSYISRLNATGGMDFYVLDRESGEPLKNVKVETFFQQYNYTTSRYDYVTWKKYNTGETGLIEMPPLTGEAYSYKYFYAEMSRDDDQLVTDNYFSQYANNVAAVEKKTIRSFYFTDRAIYRPGQTVYFKGIILDREGEKYTIKTNYSTTVKLFDVNYQEAAHLDLVTNEYGTVNGSFTAPANGITGQMYITDGVGSVYFSVEEYKRPKFEVVMDTLRTTPKLNDMVAVSGNAKAYAGNAVDGASVKYRVVRNTTFPYWGYWCYFSFPSVADMEITNGTVQTDADGKFTVNFKAVPDLTLDKAQKPVFNYTVYVDVTDINGETHSSSKTLSVGYTSLLLTTYIPSEVDKKEKNEYDINAVNLDNFPVNTKGLIKVYQLKQPDKVYRSRLWAKPDKYLLSKEEYYKLFPSDLYADETDMYKWDIGKPLLVKEFNTASSKKFIIDNIKGYASGQYMLEISANDPSGEEVKSRNYFSVYTTTDTKPPTKDVFYYSAIKTNCEPGEKASFIVGSADKDVKILYEIDQRGTILHKEFIDLSNETKIIEIPVLEDYRGNVTVHLLTVKNGRSYRADITISVPFTNKMLKLEFESFRDKLTPGQQEEWKIKISGSGSDKIAAEMVATLYDASLDNFRNNNWYFDILSYNYGALYWENYYPFTTHQSTCVMMPSEKYMYKYNQYDALNWFGFVSYYAYNNRMVFRGGTFATAVTEEVDEVALVPASKPTEGKKKSKDNGVNDPVGGIALGYVSGQKGEGDKVTADGWTKKADEGGRQNNAGNAAAVRKNFNETAFFYPTLTTDDKGGVVIKFTIPEALTRWKFMAFAHTKDLKFGQIEKEAVTSKDLMVATNAPRFLRESDTIYISAKISDVADKDLTGEATAVFFDALSMTPIDAQLGNVSSTQSFTVKKGQSTSVTWKIVVPQGLSAFTYRVKAKSGDYTDGEEMTIPVLSNRMLITETLPLPVNGKQSKNFSFTKLLNSGSSKTLSNYKLTLEYTSNPAWYAIQALPYLMEYPYECSEQVFNRFYANSIAEHIMNSSPKIKAVFDSWKNLTPDALLSNLEKNQDLKSLMLEETPWVLNAKDETERKHRIALLFDLNTMSNELSKTLNKLIQKQASNGAWPWFDGMPDDRYITQYIVAGLGRLDKLGITSLRNNSKAWNMLRNAVAYLDNKISEDYEYLLKNYKTDLKENHLGETQIQYLYARSFFNSDFELSSGNKEAFAYYKGQAQKYWPKNTKYLQAMLATALKRYGDDNTPADIIRSIKETALHSEEMGMYWRDNEGGYYWYEAPVETQSVLIECFSEVTNDRQAVEDMKLWLLKQKQTQDWKTTVATADACYALLLRGTDMLASDKLVEVKVGNQVIDPKQMDGVKVEAGTGYFKTSWSGTEIKPEMGNITVTKTDDGAAWGAVYWQYFEQLDKITPAVTPLQLTKKLFVERSSATGPVIEPVTSATKLKVGDKLKVRIELRVDRDMQYVHMKDMRASGFEPINVISQYKYQDGLGYYESTRDASTNFFFDYLSKGTYVFEYPLFVSQKGDFSNGVTTIECMYAPEFTSHSEGIRVKVGD